MTITRREAMKRGGNAVVAAAALSVVPTIAGSAGEDTKLLSRVEVFWAAHKEAVGCFEKWLTEKHRVEALPECPVFRYPEATKEDHERFYAFLADHGVNALANSSHKANKRMGRAVKAVFDTPAKAYHGVLAKLKIVEAALGPGGGMGDEELEAFQDYEAPWLENAIMDFERLADQRRAI